MQAACLGRDESKAILSTSIARVWMGTLERNSPVVEHATLGDDASGVPAHVANSPHIQGEQESVLTHSVGSSLTC